MQHVIISHANGDYTMKDKQKAEELLKLWATLDNACKRLEFSTPSTLHNDVLAVENARAKMDLLVKELAIEAFKNNHG